LHYTGYYTDRSYNVIYGNRNGFIPLMIQFNAVNELNDDDNGIRKILKN